MLAIMMMKGSAILTHSFRNSDVLTCSSHFFLPCGLFLNHQASLVSAYRMFERNNTFIQIKHWPKGKHFNGFLPKSQYSSHTQRRQALYILQFGCLLSSSTKCYSTCKFHSSLIHPSCPLLLPNLFANIA